MKTKFTTEYFITRSETKHNKKYNYSKSVYVNNITPTIIICHEHGEFLQKPIHHLKGNGCPKCAGNHKRTTIEFIRDANIVHNDRYDYSKSIYVNNETLLIITCKIHGDFEQVPVSHINLKRGCPKCNGGVPITVGEFIRRSNITHGNKYSYEKVKYINSVTKVEIICKIHGSFYQQPNKHTSGDGCPKCANNIRKTNEEFAYEANLVHDNRYSYDKVNYKNGKTKVIITCPDHGDFKQVPINHLFLKHGCPKCGLTLSKGELAIEDD